jgi:penicillin-binding protein 2
MQPQFDLRDPQLEARIFGVRTIVAIGLVVVLLSVILMRYYALQITGHEVYRTQSERNRVQLQPLPPRRGLIYDRNGVLLADNRPS